MVDVILAFIVVLYLSWHIYATYYRPMKKFTHFEVRARRYEARKKYQTSIDIRNLALNLGNLSKQEHAHLVLAIGGAYIGLNKPDVATKYFDAFFEEVHDVKYPYDRQYRKVIQAYINCGRNHDARRILDALIARQNYDKRFKRFEKLKAELFQ